jgi:transcriptional regulator with XRE-family HTH domain
MASITEEFASRVRRARETRRLTRGALDRAAGLAGGHAARIEDGSRSNVTLVTAERIAMALEVRLGWLVAGEGRGP